MSGAGRTAPTIVGNGSCSARKLRGAVLKAYIMFSTFNTCVGAGVSSLLGCGSSLCALNSTSAAPLLFHGIHVSAQVKQLIQGVLEAMEQQNPHPVPLRSRTSPGSAAKQPSSTRSSSTPEAAGLQPVPELLGDWDLVFASNGTVSRHH